MRRFFLGLESGLGTRQLPQGGIIDEVMSNVAMGTRHPILATGNVQVLDTYRDVKEVGRGTQDDIFNAFKNTQRGKAAIASLQKKTGRLVDGFGGVAKMWGEGTKHRKAIDMFFNEMHRNLNDFFTKEGGGVVYQPVRELNVHYADPRSGARATSKYRVDFGVAAQAFGDFDGDAWSMVLFDKGTGGKIINAMKDTRNPQSEYMQRLNRYQATFAVFGEEAKGALKNMSKTLATSEMTLDKQIVNDLMKEYAAKSEVGMVDVGLSKVRRSIMDMTGATVDQITEANTLLQVLQEHTVIKGKKLPVFMPFAARTVESVRAMFEGDAGMFKRFVTEQVFQGSQLQQGPITLTGAAGDYSSAISKNLQGHTIDLFRAVDTVVEAVMQSRMRPSIDAASAGTTAAMLNRKGDRAMTPSQVMGFLMGEDDMVGGAIGGYEGSSRSARISVADAIDIATDSLARTAKMNMKAAIMPTAIGLAGSILMGGMMTRMSSAPGGGANADDLRLREQQAAGSMFNPRPNPEPAQTFEQRDMSSVNNNPHHMRRVKTRQNFNVNGTLGHGGQINAATSAMSNMPNMSGSVHVYDDRQPMTGAYVERLLGLD